MVPNIFKNIRKNLINKRKESFRKAYPKIYEIISNYNIQNDDLRTAQEFYNKQLNSVRNTIEELDKFLKILPESSPEYRRKFNELADSKEIVRQLLSRLNLIDIQLKDLFTNEVLIALTFYNYYINKTSYNKETDKI